MATKVVMDGRLKKIAYSAVPRTQARAWLSRTEHFLTHKGEEWMVERNKALWNAANLHRSGAHEQASRVLRSSRIAITSSGYPLGVEGAIVRAYAGSRRPSSTRRLAAVLRGYTSVRLSEPSKAQVDKARKSITDLGPSRQYDLFSFERRRKHEGLRNYNLRMPRESCVTMIPGPSVGRWARFKKNPTIEPITKLSGTTRYPSPVALPNALKEGKKEKPFARMILSLMTRGSVPESLLSCYSEDRFPTYDRYGQVTWHDDIPLRRVAEQYQESAGDPYLGKIVILQEGGAKGRTICSPNAWIQYYMYPLHSALCRYIKRLEERKMKCIADGKLGFGHGYSCMFNQTLGANHTQEVLSRGGFCAAVDLSSATDRFPLTLQLKVLDEIGLGDFTQALRDLRGPYQGPDGRPWRYKVGQPMGLYGSFALFHLTHWSLLEGLVYRLGLDRRRDGVPLYSVLGDDVLIYDRALLHAYRRELERWGVPISEHKCFEGNLTEFAGFIISRKGDNVSSFRPYKYVEGQAMPVLTTLHAVGSRVRSWSSFWSKAYDAYQATLGKRDPALEPLVSTSDQPERMAALPGEGYLTMLVTGLGYALPQLSSEALTAWDDCCLGLLQATESLSDIGRPGVSTGESFDPETYEAHERVFKTRDGMYRHQFDVDPLVSEYRDSLIVID